MKDLTTEVNAVFTARSIADKKSAMLSLIENSHAKAETKKLSKLRVERLMHASAVDKFATNYLLSGEGMKI
jgi:hypothetical protein|tara:strand:+ start:3605 stop:3817 length:213 start_codon:yes stop_codon:yes gene_type:complete